VQLSVLTLPIQHANNTADEYPCLQEGSNAQTHALDRTATGMAYYFNILIYKIEEVFKCVALIIIASVYCRGVVPVPMLHLG